MRGYARSRRRRWRRRTWSDERLRDTAWRKAREPGLWWITLAVIVFAIEIGLSWIYWSELRGETESLSTTLRNVGIVIGGSIAIIFAIWRSTVSERQSQIALLAMPQERYSTAAQALGSEELLVRLAQIHALERLAQDHPDEYHVQVLELLCAFIRNPTFVEATDVSNCETIGLPTIHRLKSPIREDVQAAITAIGIGIGRRFDLERRRRFKFNLSGADLRGANLEGLDFSPPNWRHSGPITSMAKFLQSANTDMTAAKLCGSNMEFSSFRRADFRGACFCYSILPYDLSEADLSRTNWKGAILGQTNLSGAQFNDHFGHYPARGATQAVLDECEADSDNPPNLRGVIDVETGSPVVWKGSPRPRTRRK